MQNGREVFILESTKVVLHLNTNNIICDIHILKEKTHII
jgi:hypothetical protein